MWGGGKSKDLPVDAIPLWKLLSLFGLIPLWLLRNPVGMLSITQRFFRRFPKSFLNLQEVLLGMGMGILLASRVAKEKPRWIHAIWATAPATAALTIQSLIGTRFSFGAHAYDLFQDGGDCLLAEKISAATWIRTSTQAAAEELIRRGAPPKKINLIRRGLPELPQKIGPRPAEGTIRLLSIGRLVPKKGYPDFIRLCNALDRHGVSFEATIIGEGPLRSALTEQIRSLKLEPKIRLLGSLPRPEVEPYLKEADLFIFTGVVSRDGDRDGLPNVIPEALAHGIPVLTRSAPGVLEAIRHDETGIVLSGSIPEDWAAQVIGLWSDTGKRTALSSNGRKWVEENFLSQNNTQKLLEKILSSPELKFEDRK